jgi:hypothetical protein
MDRRRFIPTSLGSGLELETRQLLTTAAPTVFGSSTSIATPTVTTSIGPNLAQRLDRIDHLPFIMISYQTNRSLPESVIAPIQNDLIAIVGTINNPPSSVFLAFNRTIRSVEANKTLSPLAAKSLVNAFDSLLKYAGTSDGLRAKFTADMLTLAQLDATGPEPTIQAINDFGIIAQLTVAVGQPFAAPSAPTLLAADKVDRLNVTANHFPRFVGTAAPAVTIRIVNYANGNIIAQGSTDKNGAYTIQATSFVPDGTYHVHAQTADAGFLSLFSPVYNFRVFTPKPKAAVPKGPLG